MRDYFKQVFNRIKKDVKDYWALAAVYGVYYVASIAFFKASCPSIYLTGFPCPGCGMTRAVIAIMKFEYKKAYELNPLSFAVVLYIISFLLYRYLVGKSTKVFFVLLIVLAVALMARYFYGMIRWYPNRIPFVYTKNNLLYKILHLLNFKF